MHKNSHILKCKYFSILKKPSIRHHTRVHVPTLPTNNKGLYSNTCNSINFESRVNRRYIYKPRFYFLFVEYTCIHISVSLATAKLITLTVNFINLSILSLKFIQLILTALWFHSFSKITCARNCVLIMKGRIKIHSPTKLFLHTKGSKKSFIYYMYLFVRINSVTIIVQ